MAWGSRSRRWADRSSVWAGCLRLHLRLRPLAFLPRRSSSSAGAPQRPWRNSPPRKPCCSGTAPRRRSWTRKSGERSLRQSSRRASLRALLRTSGRPIAASSLRLRRWCRGAGNLRRNGRGPKARQAPSCEIGSSSPGGHRSLRRRRGNSSGRCSRQSCQRSWPPSREIHLVCVRTACKVTPSASCSTPPTATVFSHASLHQAVGWRGVAGGRPAPAKRSAQPHMGLAPPRLGASAQPQARPLAALPPEAARVPPASSVQGLWEREHPLGWRHA